MPGRLKRCHLQKYLVFLAAKIRRAFAKEKIQKTTISTPKRILNSNPATQIPDERMISNGSVAVCPGLHKWGIIRNVRQVVIHLTLLSIEDRNRAAIAEIEAGVIGCINGTG
jgi:hypothetical protein